MASESRTRDQRVAVAAAWLKVNCPFEDHRLHDCLFLEIVPAVLPKPQESHELYLMNLDDEWDCTEFEEAFKRMKSERARTEGELTRLTAIATAIYQRPKAASTRKIDG